MCVCVQHDFTTENDMAAAWHWCKGNDSGVLPSPEGHRCQAYPNCSKSNKVEGLVVALEGPKLICHEEKVVVVFCHPPKVQQAEEFDF